MPQELDRIKELAGLQQEAPATGDQALAKDLARLYKEMVEVINDNSDNPDDIESDYNWGYGPDDDEEARALMKAFNTSLQAGLQLVKKIKIERGKSLLGDESDWDPFHPQSERHDELKAMFAKYGEKFPEESAVQPVNSSVDDTIQRARAQIETLESALKEDYKKFQGMKPYKPKKK